MALKLKKIYPLALSEIRMFEVLGEPKLAKSDDNNLDEEESEEEASE